MLSPASQQIIGLVSGYSHGLSRLLLMLQAYIDDSGKEPPVHVMGGFIAPAEKWLAFSDAWKAVLDDEPRPLEYFKMKEAASLRKCFKGWTIEERDKRLDALIAVIKGHVTIGIRTILITEDYNELIRGKIDPALDHPYFFLYDYIMMAVMQFQRERQWKQPVDFIFDEQTEIRRSLETWDLFVELAPEAARPYIGQRPIHRSDKEVLPLQAADMLVWRARRHCYERSLRPTVVPQIIGSQLNSIPCINFVLTRERLERILEKLRMFRKETGRKFYYDVT